MPLLPSFGAAFEQTALAVLVALLCGFSSLVWKVFRCPAELRHLPRVPVLPTLISFLSGETEDLRIKRLLLPTARRHNSKLVAIWALGQWYVHVLDHKLARELMDNKTITKMQPPTGMMFWRLTGTENIFFSDGDVWKNQAQAVRGVLHQNVPIETFVSLMHKVIAALGDGGRVRWSSFSHRYTLDVVGHAVFGHDFESIEHPDNSVVSKYQHVMTEVSQPLYVGFPIFERWLPRTDLARRVDELREWFRQLLEHKRENPGKDFVSHMLAQPPMTDVQYLDNIITMFMAGHDTTAGALSSVIYYLSKHPEYQARARAEALSALQTDKPSDFDAISSITTEQFQSMPFLNACIRESMRLNGSSVSTIPRISSAHVQLGEWVIPPHVPIALNMYGILHNDDVFADTTWQFRPDRWLESQSEEINAGWIPFSLGHRRCPAMNFSLYEQRTVLAMMLCKYEWSLPADSIHSKDVKNAFSTFALNLPEDLDIDLRRLV
ncbi:cytochrome P450 [Trametopsis cervina]|nr:cytochrome P450 [Trametopsis cervina]